MSEYQVIARKWRPQRFADVVGQEHIVTTLKNAIRRQRTAHAYLFVGPRGIGKTTTARIFAKALNCEAPEDGEPCCKCQSCITIADESNIDVREIDAASQNSVDSIRELRDDAMHTPVSCRYKIYVIDEVHMLSKQAWNALLKTVEEPPPHVKFIFATTEVHQVLGTIISRCQRFDLQRISSRLICERLRKIADAEAIRISDVAIEAVARAADGGMRDAQSLLDQMIAFFGDANDEISEAQVLSLFGLSTTAELESLIKAIFTNNAAGVIAAIYNLSCRGKNLETLFNDLLSWLRAIQICGLIANPENILEDGLEMIAHYRQLAGQVKPKLVQLLLEVLAPVGRTLHDALNKQVFLEAIILKAMRSAHAIQIEDLIARLNQLRNKNELDVLDKLPALAEQPIPQVVPNVASIAPVEVKTATTVKPEPQPVARAVVGEQVVSAQATATVPPSNAETVIPATKTTSPVIIKTQSTELDNIEDVAIKPSMPEPPVRQVADQEPENLATEPVSENIIVETDSAVAMPADELVEAQDFKLENQTPAELVAEHTPQLPLTAHEVWHRMIQRFANQERTNPQLKNFMLEATPESFENSTLTVCFDDEYENEHYSAINDAMPLMNKLLQEVVDDWAAVIDLQKRPGVKKVSLNDNRVDAEEDDDDDVTEDVAEPLDDYNIAETTETIDIPNPDEKVSLFSDEAVKKRCAENELVKYSVDMFGGRIVDIHG